MTGAADPRPAPPPQDPALPVPAAARRRIAAWEITGGLVVFFVGSFLHFLYELSGFNILAAPFASVNESTWEHLKLFFWPGLVFAVVEHAYLRDRVNNFWAAKAASAVGIMAGVAISFYAYLGVVIPIDGKGTLAGTLVTAVIGCVLGQALSYRLLVMPSCGPRWRITGGATLAALALAFVAFTFVPPRNFLFENFAGYVYGGEYGILDDYTPYLIFR